MKTVMFGKLFMFIFAVFLIVVLISSCGENRNITIQQVPPTYLAPEHPETEREDAEAERVGRENEEWKDSHECGGQPMAGGC